jgi:hypothetical protein
MTLRLLARSRRVGEAVVMLAVCGAASAVWAARRAADPEYAGEPRYLLPLLVVAPTACAMLCGSSTGSSLRWLEDASPRRLAPWRGVHAVLLTVVTAVCLLPAAAFGTADYGVVAALRNVVMMVGLALLGAAVLGAEVAWFVPLVYASLTYVLGASASRVPDWAVLVQPASASTAWLYAVGVFVCGLGGYCWLGAGMPWAHRLTRAPGDG